MKKILALTDFSENGHHAVLYALELAKAWKSPTVTLLNTFDAPILFQGDLGAPLMPDGSPNFMDYSLLLEQSKILEEGNRERMEQLKIELQPQVEPGIQVEGIVKQGFLEDTVNEICSSGQYDLVVMGITGKSGLEKVLVGSNAIKAIEAIEYPLLIVPAKSRLEVPQKVLLASDLELLKEKPLQQLRYFLNESAGALTVVTINKNPEDEVTIEKAAALKAQLQDLVPEIQYLEAENVESGLHEFADREKISLIIFVHHEKGFFGSLFHKSISKQIAWNSTVPLLRLKE